MSSAITVADEILKISKKKNRTLTPLQLMKLVYIAHGWYLALYNKDLFQERIEAWKYGPVIPDLYRATKRFGRDPIPLHLIEAGGSNVDAKTKAFLEDVFNKYGHLSGIELSRLTHKSGSPWDQVYQPGIPNIEIEDGVIQAHYKKLLDDYRRSSAATS